MVFRFFRLPLLLSRLILPFIWLTSMFPILCVVRLFLALDVVISISMACLSPLTVRFNDVLSGSVMRQEVPCGHCIACRVRQQNDWMLRSVFHFREWSSCVFATLTYGDAHICRHYLVPRELRELDNLRVVVKRRYEKYPFVYSLRRSDVRSWLKRCRIRFKRATSKDVTYMYVGEYGPKTFRPHYHILLFGVTLNEFYKYFRMDWESRFGFVRRPRQVSLNDPAFSYTAKYASKPFEFENPLVTYGFVEKPRKVASNNFGMWYVYKNKDWHLGLDSSSEVMSVLNSTLQVSQRQLAVSDRRFVSYNGFHYSLPLYYGYKIFGCGQENVPQLLERRVQQSIMDFRAGEVFAQRLLCATALSPGISLDEAVKVIRREDEENDRIKYRRCFRRCKEYFDKSSF